MSRAVDLVMDRMLGLPEPRTGYVAELGIPTPLDDGTVLVADHYRPTSVSHGTILVRTPYGRGFPGAVLYGRAWAARGYHVLLQSCRGTFGSEAHLRRRWCARPPTRRRRWRGCAEQPWFDGRLATLGGSYLGWTQWALMMDPPPELQASIVVVAPHDMAESVYGAGPFTLNDFLGWAYLMAHQEVRGPLGGDLWRSFAINRKLRPALGGLPLRRSVESVLAGRAPWFLEWLDHPDLTDPFWEPMRLGASLRRAEVPVLLIGGWQDVFLRHTIEEYEALHGRGVDVALTVGPWTSRRLRARRPAGIWSCRQTLGWLDEHLAGIGRRDQDQRRCASTSPAARRLARPRRRGRRGRVTTTWYLRPGGALGAGEPAAGRRAVPASGTTPPTPRPATPAGGSRRTPACGTTGGLEARADVLTFTSSAARGGHRRRRPAGRRGARTPPTTPTRTSSCGCATSIARGRVGQLLGRDGPARPRTARRSTGWRPCGSSSTPAPTG